MGIDESEASRLLRGDVPSDDPVWGEVSSFLDTVGTAYPVVPTTALEGRHLAAIAHETRLSQSELRRPRQGAVKRLFTGSHRVLAGSVGALVIALSAGIGVASALGINPLGQLLAPFSTASSQGPQATSKTSGSDPADGNTGDEPGTVPPQTVPGSVPTPTGLPTPSPTASTSESDEDAAKASAKAEKEAEKEAEKAKKDAEKAAEKARKDAEKAAKEAEKNKAKATPTPSPTNGKGKGKGNG